LPEPPPIIDGLMSYRYMQVNSVVWDEETIARRLHGEFFEGAQSMLVPFDWLDLAMDAKRWRELLRRDRRAEAMGIDVAFGGADKTCWTVIDRHGIIEQIITDEGNAVKTAERTMALIRKHDLTPSRVAMDAGAGGGAVCNFIHKGIVNPATGRMESAPIKVVSFGERPGADDSGKGKGKRKLRPWSEIDPAKAYFNRRAEMYGGLRDVLNPVQPEGSEPFMFGPDAWELRKELAPIPLMHDDEGRMVLPPKDSDKRGVASVRKLIGHSPDRSDSLVLALHALRHGRGMPTVVDPSAIELDRDRMDAVARQIQENVAKRMADRGRR
jgi:hypothetical protein